MITFKFETSPSIVGCRVAMARVGQYWNATPGAVKWEDMPADGRPLPAHLFVPVPFFSKGPPSSIWQVEIGAAAADMAEAVAIVFAADGTGKVFDKIGMWPFEYSDGVRVYITGGSFSSSR